MRSISIAYLPKQVQTTQSYPAFGEQTKIASNKISITLHPYTRTVCSDISLISHCKYIYTVMITANIQTFYICFIGSTMTIFIFSLKECCMIY